MSADWPSATVVHTEKRVVDAELFCSLLDDLQLPVGGVLIEAVKLLGDLVFPLSEGRGVLVGCRQVFIRFAGCNLNCRYCDTDFASVGKCQFEDPPGSGSLDSLENPVSLGAVCDLIDQWCEGIAG